MAASKTTPLIEVPELETAAHTGLSVIEGRADRVDPFALAMDQALRLETRPLSTLSGWNKHAIEFAGALAPMVCDLFSLAVKACVELQLNWLSWIPGWQLGDGGQVDSGADGTGAGESQGQRRIRLAENMDVAIGAHPALPAPAALPHAAGAAPAATAAAADSAEEQPDELEAAMAAGGVR